MKKKAKPVDERRREEDRRQSIAVNAIYRRLVKRNLLPERRKGDRRGRKKRR